MSLACPCCDSEMQPYRVGRTELDHCTCCDGLWFDGGELEEVVGASVPAQGSFPQYRSCQRCKRTMKRVMLDKTSVERCDDCSGYFLDADELEAIVAVAPAVAATAAAATAAAPKVPAAPVEDAGPREFDCLKCEKRFPIAQAYSVPGGRICDKCSGFIPAKTEPSKLVAFFEGVLSAIPVSSRRRRGFFDL